jgi:hypothetical protein
MEQIECSETLANINQTPGKHPKDSTLNIKHGESLKSRKIMKSMHSVTILVHSLASVQPSQKTLTLAGIKHWT